MLIIFMNLIKVEYSFCLILIFGKVIKKINSSKIARLKKCEKKQMLKISKLRYFLKYIFFQYRKI